MADSPSPSQREFDLLLKIINDGFEGTHVRLDRLNGTVADHAEDIATLKERTSTASGRANTGMWSGLAGIITYLGTLLWNKWTN